LKIEDLRLAPSVTVVDSDVLIVVDMQNDFMPSGALPVEGGDEIIDPINSLAEDFSRHGGVVVMTQDWHPPGHLSFASSHGMEPYTLYSSEGIGPILWPDHCVQGSAGADFHSDVNVDFANAIIRKGFRMNIDSYSVFVENDKKTVTGLSGYLKTLGKTRIFLCGLALDYCVFHSAIDGIGMGFNVVVPIDLSRAVDAPPGRLSEALDLMVERVVRFVKSSNIVFQ